MKVGPNAARAHNGRSAILLPAVLVALLAALLYWPALGLPLLYDDLLHIRLTGSLDWRTVWLPSDDFAFYRPLVFAPFLVIRALFGRYPAGLLHALPVAQHALDVFLLTTLVWRLWRDRAWALTAGLLLAVFPFAYQAVVMYANNIYPLSAGLMLIGLHVYLSGLRTGRPVLSDDHSRLSKGGRWWALAGLVFLIFLLSHETAVLFGPLAFLLHWNERGRLPRPNFRAPWLLFTLLGVLYALAYQFLPTGAPPRPDFDSNDPAVKALYFLQIAAYPLTWFGHLLPDLSAHLIILGATAVTGLWTLWAIRRHRFRLPLLFGWGWWGAASLLLAIPLPTYYLTHGARLFYLGAVGLAVAWAGLIVALRRLGRAGLLAMTAVLLLIAISNIQFVGDRLAAYETITQSVDVMSAVMNDRPAGEGVVFINLPSWTAPARNTYPIGAEFVTMMGGHLFVEELVHHNLLLDRPAMAIKVDELLTDPGYGYGVHEQGQTGPLAADWTAGGSHVFVTSYLTDTLPTRYAGQFTPRPNAAAPLAHLGGYDLLAADARACNDRVTVALTWSRPATAVPAATTSMFVQLLDENGRLIAQSDNPPLGLPADLVVLPPGWQVTGYRELALQPEDGRPQQLLVGVYDYVTGQRAAAQAPTGDPLPDNAFSLPITPCQ